MSPQAFNRCIKTPGSKKFTKELKDGKYIHGCKMPGSKTAIWGEVKESKGTESFLEKK